MGKAIALRLAQEGARVAINDLELKPVQQAAAAITKRYGVRTLALAGSVDDPEAIQRMVDAVQAKFGRIDILINNAGILYPTCVLAISREEWLRAWCVKRFPPHESGPMNGCFPYPAWELPAKWPISCSSSVQMNQPTSPAHPLISTAVI